MQIFVLVFDFLKEIWNILVCKKRIFLNFFFLNKDDVDDILDLIIEKMMVQNNLFFF